MDDINPRPQKRLRTDHPSDAQLSAPQPSSSMDFTPTYSPLSTLRPLPPHILLLALPALLAHPPSHEHYPLSLFLSLRALRTCLELKALTPDIECRAWTAFAEVGLRVINSGFSTSGEHEWAKGIETEVENAIGKGLLIAQKHPSLRSLRHHLSLLNAQFASQTNNTKYARALLRRLIASFVASDPPSIVYTAHLTLITHLTSPPQTTHGETTASASAAELQAALTIITTLSTLAARNRHPAIEDLAAVLRVRVLVAAGMWDLVGDALATAEKAMHMIFQTLEENPTKTAKGENVKPDTAAEALMRSYSITAQDVNDSAASQSQPSNAPPYSNPAVPATIPAPKAKDPLTLSLTAHILIFGIIYHTHAGRARVADSRMTALHALMDSGALVGGSNADGLVQILLPGHDPIHLRVTHPRIMFLLTFLISATAKRDPVSRRPKKRVFAECGVVQCREGRAEGSSAINVPSWSCHDDVKGIEQDTLQIEADLLCELVVVSIQRSDFDTTESHLATLVAFARTHDIFTAYSPRITLLYAHLAHALGDTERALTCYRVAAHLDGASPVGSTILGGGFIAAAARAGEALLRIGLTASPSPPPSDPSLPMAQFDPHTNALIKDALARCSTPGASCPLPALAELVSSAASHSHIIRSKSLLKQALELSSSAGDNHLRALVLAVVGAQYVYTAPAHAMEVLAVCETLGAGMGANPRTEAEAEGGSGAQRTPSVADSAKDSVGNAPLRLWVGERFLELFRRAGKDNRVRKQEAFNAVYQSAVNDLAVHRARLW